MNENRVSFAFFCILSPVPVIRRDEVFVVAEIFSFTLLLSINRCKCCFLGFFLIEGQSKNRTEDGASSGPVVRKWTS